MNKNKKFERFLIKAKKVHGDLYDYSKVEYSNCKTPICIIDPEYGEFWQTPDSHLRGANHPKRGNGNALKKRTDTKEKFIKKAKEIHGNLYNYSKVKYVNQNTKILIIDPEYGEFWQRPLSHLNGSGCPKRAYRKNGENKSLTTEDFIQRAKKIHGDIYDYSKVEYINRNTKVEIICKHHGTFYQLPFSHLNGHGCPVCKNKKISNKLSLTTEDFIQRAKKVHGDIYDYSKVEYVHSSIPVKIIDKEYGEFEQLPFIHLSGCGNPLRKNSKISQKLSLGKDEFIRKAKIIHGDRYDYSLVNYKNNNTHVTIIDSETGIRFKQTPQGHLNCETPKALYSINSSLKTKMFISKAKEVHGDKYDYSFVKYNKNIIQIKIRCPKHGDFFQTPADHLKGHGCKLCSFESLSLSTDEFVEKSKNIHNNKYDYSLVNYKNNTTKVNIICPKHGEFTQTPANHLCGNGCPKCGSVSSQYESMVKEYLIKNNIHFLERGRNIISPYELDFFLPDHNIAIEINGHFWHSELNGKDKNYHLNKTNLCKEKSIHLIHLFENELKFNKKATFSMLNSIFNKNKYPIYARKCEIKELDHNIKEKFLDKYHLQGTDSSSVRLGLFYKNKLVSVMTFKKQFNKDDGFYELSRFCGNNMFYVIGGASKLLKYFEKKYKPKEIKTYADKRWSKGEVYFKLGFKLSHESSPNYWYFFRKSNHSPLIHRFNFRKSELFKKLENFDLNKTEWENMVNNGWDRIWDCGNMVFVKKYHFYK